MERIGTIETICRYPVKSMAGENVAQAFVGFAGLMGDRAFAFVRTSGPKGFPWHTGREQEDLVLFRPHFREGGAATLPPDIEEAFKMAPGVNPIFPTEGAFEIDAVRQRLGQTARGRARHAARPPPLSGQPLCRLGERQAVPGERAGRADPSDRGAAAPNHSRA